jgi:hypothetical protein
MAFEDSIAASTFSLQIPNSCAGVCVRVTRRAKTWPEAANISTHLMPSVLHATVAATGSGVLMDAFHFMEEFESFKGRKFHAVPHPP